MKNILSIVLLAWLPQTDLYAGDGPPADIDPSYFGISMGTPGGLNIVGGKAMEHTTLRFTAGLIPDWDGPSYGVEVGATILRRSREHTFRSIQVIAGTSKTGGTGPMASRWTYAGLSTTFRFSGGQYIEPGLTVGNGDFQSPQISLQAGMVFDL